MQVHIISPNDPNKNLGKAYNEAIQMIPDDDWVCITDLDVLFLTPDAGNILYEYANRHDKEILNCYANRIHPRSVQQLLNGTVNEDSDIKHHIELAEKQKSQLYKTTRINTKQPISMILMLIKKSTWKETKFPELGKCLGVDTEFFRILDKKDIPVLRMDGLYVWHTYRLTQGINNKDHLL